jgi:hypothetical protein
MKLHSGERSCPASRALLIETDSRQKARGLDLRSAKPTVGGGDADGECRDSQSNHWTGRGASGSRERHWRIVVRGEHGPGRTLSAFDPGAWRGRD